MTDLISEAPALVDSLDRLGVRYIEHNGGILIPDTRDGRRAIDESMAWADARKFRDQDGMRWWLWYR